MRWRAFAALAGLAAIVAVALLGGAVFKGGSHNAAQYGKFSLSDPDSKAQTPGLGPGMTWDTYLQAAEAYPANAVTPAQVRKAEATFEGLAAKDAKAGDPKGKGHKWEQYGPRRTAPSPASSRSPARRTTRRAARRRSSIDPDCGSKGKATTAASGSAPPAAASGGRTTRPQPNPEWKQLKAEQLDQNSVGVLTLDPTDKKGNTLYLGTGEGNRCSSGCEAGVGIYKSTNGGDKWTKLDDTCVSNADVRVRRPRAWTRSSAAASRRSSSTRTTRTTSSSARRRPFAASRT